MNPPPLAPPLSLWGLVVLFLAVVAGLFLARLQGVGLGKALLVEAVLAALTLVVLALALKLFFHLDHPISTGAGIGAILAIATATLWQREGGGLERFPRIALAAVGTGPLLGVLLLLLWPSAAAWRRPQVLLPLYGIASAVSLASAALFVQRFRRALHENLPSLETRLALGASGHEAIRHLLREVREQAYGLRLRVLLGLGFVQVPGMMAGMLLAGVEPFHAALIQIAFLFWLSLCVVLAIGICSRLLAREVFEEDFRLTDTIDTFLTTPR